MSEAATAGAYRGPGARAWLWRYRWALRLASLLLIVLGLAPLAGAPDEPARTLGLLGCQLFGLALTLGNALDDGGLRGFLRAQALALLLFAGLRTLYLLLDPQSPPLALLIGILLPGGIAASFLLLRSRL